MNVKKENSSIFSVKHNDALQFVGAFTLAVVVGILLSLVRNNNLLAGLKIVVSPTPTPIPRVEPRPSYVPIQILNQPSQYQQAPTQYQNYGWYMHNGQSMQYVNGNWYTTPQQDVTLQPSNQPNSNNSQNYMAGYVSVPCTTNLGTYTEWGRTYEEAESACQQLRTVDANSTNLPTIPPMPTLQPAPVIYTPSIQSPSPLPNVPTPLPPCTEYAIAMGYPCQK